MHGDEGVVAEQDRVAADAAGAHRDAGVMLERQAGPRPVGLQVLEREVGLAHVGDVAGLDDIQNGGRVGGRGRSDPVRHRWTLPAPHGDRPGGPNSYRMRTGVPIGTRG